MKLRKTASLLSVAGLLLAVTPLGLADHCPTPSEAAKSEWENPTSSQVISIPEGSKLIKVKIAFYSDYTNRQVQCIYQDPKDKSKIYTASKQVDVNDDDGWHDDWSDGWHHNTLSDFYECTPSTATNCSWVGDDD